MSSLDDNTDPVVVAQRKRLQDLANQRDTPGNFVVGPDRGLAGQALDPRLDPTGRSLAASGGKSAEERAAAAAPPPATAPPTPSSGGTQAGLQGQWSDFLSRPEHRAGLMQFAVNMLAGRGLGESIGSAAEATGRNVTAQQEEQKYEEAQALKEEEEARKERETDYYGIMARKKGGADSYYDKMAARMDADAQRADINEFEKWKADALPDARFYALQKRFKNLKEKADLYDPANAEALEYARTHMFTRGAPTVGRPGAAAAPAGPQPVYDKKTGALRGYWDGKKYTPGGPD